MVNCLWIECAESFWQDVDRFTLSLTVSGINLTERRQQSPNSQIWTFLLLLLFFMQFQGRIQDFKLGGGARKKIAPSGGRRENFGGISCEKSRFYAKKSYFFQLRGEARKILGYFVWKITIIHQKIIFFPILGGARAGCASPWIRPCNQCLSPLKLWVRTPFIARCTRYNIMW